MTKALLASQIPAAMPLIERRIYVIRVQKVMLASDLAEIYQVPTKALNQAVKRNPARFPEDFMFRLSDAELQSRGEDGGTPATLRLHRTTARPCSPPFSTACAQQRPGPQNRTDRSRPKSAFIGGQYRLVDVRVQPPSVIILGGR